MKIQWIIIFNATCTIEMQCVHKLPYAWGLILCCYHQPFWSFTRKSSQLKVKDARQVIQRWKVSGKPYRSKLYYNRACWSAYCTVQVHKVFNWATFPSNLDHTRANGVPIYAILAHLGSETSWEVDLFSRALNADTRKEMSTWCRQCFHCRLAEDPTTATGSIY